MFIIGELINGMYANIARAIKERDKSEVQKCALEQIENGADALDINCGAASKQPHIDMSWLVETVQEVTDKPLSLDSSKIQVIEAGLKAAKNKTIINSVTADSEKLDNIIPLAKEHNSQLIGITISKKGIPQNKDQRLELAATIVGACIEKSFPVDSLYLDPIVLPVNVAQGQLKDILESIRDFKIISDPPPKTTLGLSNVSQGTNTRSLINRTFLVMAVAYGLDSAILDPKDKELMDALITAELILNKNIYCDLYLNAYRKK
ncbi:MAG: dihydropteroate synthase [Candidatus Omnitrophota bacterium]|jgi:5-methyltetrahydrofolate corrinoid/iron sulfur protein methyltransferase